MARVFSKRDQSLRNKKVQRPAPKVLPTIRAPAPKVARQPLGKYYFPVAAIELAEDVIRLEMILALMEQIDVDNLTKVQTIEDRQYSRDMLRSTRALVRTWHRYAQNKMRQKYLANT